MIFSAADIELLRLTGWCKDLPLASAGQEFLPEEVAALEALGYLTVTKAKALRLRAAGGRLLSGLGVPMPSNKWPTSKDHILKRRYQAAAILVTCHRAGLQVYADCLADLKTPPVFLPSAAVRRNEELGGNVFHGTRFAGILHLPGWSYIVHFVGPNAGGISYLNEMKSFHSVTASLDTLSGMVFAGAGYAQVWHELTEDAPTRAGPKRAGMLQSYGEVYAASALPVHLLSCDGTGALQLAVMCQADYRGRLTRLVLGNRFRPPEEGLPDCDGMSRERPFVLAVDMDLKRIDRACAQAHAGGYPLPGIAALEGQSALLKNLYETTARGVVYDIKPKALTDAFGAACALRVPSHAPFCAGGELVHHAAPVGPTAKAVQVDGEMGNEY